MGARCRAAKVQATIRPSIVNTDSSQRLLADSRDDRERLRLILIGSAIGVREMIHKLHVCRVADAGNWSRLLPVPNSDEVMSILVIDRPRSRNPIG